MENIISERKQGLFIVISVHRGIADKLKKLGQGSYNKAIGYLLNNKIDDKLSSQLNELQDRMGCLEETIERICNFNRLKH